MHSVREVLEADHFFWKMKKSKFGFDRIHALADSFFRAKFGEGQVKTMPCVSTKV